MAGLSEKPLETEEGTTESEFGGEAIRGGGEASNTWQEGTRLRNDSKGTE